MSHGEAPVDGDEGAGQTSGKYVPRHRARSGGSTITRRRWPRRILVGLNVLVALAIVVAGLGVGYAYWRLNQIDRVHVSAEVPVAHDPQSSVLTERTSPTAPARRTQTTKPPKPLPVLPAETFLIVGSDTRAGLDQPGDKQVGTASEVGGARSDTIMLARVVPATKQIALLSIPRDTYLDIPTLGMQKINAALSASPNLLIRVIKKEYGIDVNHYVDVDFDSFRDIANALGGVKIYFPTEVRDVNAGLYIGGPSCVNLTGNLALAFVRSREYTYYVPGRGWVQEPQSDLARIQRQQMFIRKLAAKAQSKGINNPFTLDKLIGALTKNLTVDDSLSNGELINLATTFRNINPNNIVGWTMPASASVLQTPQGPDDILIPEHEADQEMVSQFLAFGAAPAPASSTASGDSAASESGSGTTPPASGSTGTTSPPGSPTTSSATASGGKASGGRASGGKGSGDRASNSKASKKHGSTTTSTTSTVPPSTIEITVYNGSGIAGQAGDTGTALRGIGFDVVGLVTSPTFGHTATVVEYGPDGSAAAHTVAAHFSGRVTLKEISGLGPTSIEVITGTQTSVSAAPVSHGRQASSSSSTSSSTSTTTSTTVAPTTTTTVGSSSTTTTYVLPGTPKTGVPSCSN